MERDLIKFLYRSRVRNRVLIFISKKSKGILIKLSSISKIPLHFSLLFSTYLSSQIIEINSYKKELKTRNIIDSFNDRVYIKLDTRARPEKGKRNVLNKRARVNRAKR